VLQTMSRGADVYRRTNVHTRSPLELVVMLYDGALQSLGEARAAIGRKDVPARVKAISHAMAILTELQGTLNVKEGGKIAEELDRLYAYAINRLLDVTTKHDAKGVDDVLKILTPLRDAWSQIAQQAGEPQPAVATPAVATHQGIAVRR
jgi:flagellar protein FliS